MFHFIHNLQQKSESARRRFAFSVALVVTVCVVGIWLTTLPSRTSSERRARVEDIEVTPLRSLGESFSSFFSGLQGQFNYSADEPEEAPPAPPSTDMAVVSTTTESASSSQEQEIEEPSESEIPTVQEE